jgi:hypothetical protein
MARFRTGAKTSWEAALLEIEHQADHWNTPEHGETGHLIAQALLAAVDIARGSGLRWEHRATNAISSSPGLSSPVGWRCTFVGRAGGQAHATFASVEQAKVFAELHAQASGNSGEWAEAGGSWVLRTPPGDYLVRWK